MGNGASGSNGGGGGGEEDDPLDPFDGIDTLGYRVLGVQPDSPAAAAGLVSFLDFLVGVNDRMLLGSGAELQPGEEYDDVDLPALLEENKGVAVEFLVWNIKSQSARLVQLVPSDTWGGAGLLGVTIRLDNYAGAEDRLIRVLSVEPHSPAAIAGLQPEKDFLLGTTHQTLDTVDRLAIGVLRNHMNQIVELYVYNTDDDKVRVVALMPTYNWGDGRGLLGAEVGTGYLHRLPATSRNTSGTSIERRVRYVNGGGENENNNDVGAVRKDGGDNDQVLEMEPQLEMEPEEAEEEEEEEQPMVHAKKNAPSNTAATAMKPPVKPAPAEQRAVESAAPMTAPPKFVSNFPPPPSLPTPSVEVFAKPTLTHTVSSDSTGPPNKPTRQVSLQSGATPTSLGPPPQIYHGRQAYSDPKSATTGYKRPSYIMPPSPSVLPPQPHSG